MGQPKSEVKHLKCCKRSSTYKPDLIRSHPFKWVNFPYFVAIWFLLFWFVICPITWSKVHNYKDNHPDWPIDWPYFFWSVALLIFCLILIVLLVLWKCAVPKSSKSKYDQIFLNPEYGDEKEILCIHCMSFHPPGGAKCPCTLNDTDLCNKCGNNKQSFNTCCQKPKPEEDLILKGPSYDVALRKQQPNEPDFPDRQIPSSGDNKRHSLRSVKSRSPSSSGFVVLTTAHDAGTKDLVNRKIDTGKRVAPQPPPKPLSDTKVTITTEKVVTTSGPVILKPQDGTVKTSSVKNRKPVNLQPVDVELANRHANVEFFGEKIPLGQQSVKTPPSVTTVVNVHYSKTCHPADNQSPSTVALKSGSVGSMNSMDKQKFSQFLHLVEINTPFTPIETIVQDDDLNNPPMSPREIFFYDLIQAAEKCDNGNSPDSTHFGAYSQFEKKRPVSHILLSSDVNLDEEPDKAKVEALKRHTINVRATENPNRKSRLVVEDLESPRILALTESIKLHASVADDDEEKTIIRDDGAKETTVKILRTIKKSTPEADSSKKPSFGDRKSFSPRSNTSSLSEQNSTHELRSLTKESVSRFFISDIHDGPPKPMRQSSSTEPANQEEASRDNINDDVFSE